MNELPQLQVRELPNGRKLAWREWGAGEPLILLHGWSMSSAVFSEVATRLSAHYRVLCPDLSGHGQSDPLATPSLDGFASAIEQWSAQSGFTSVRLLGWSFGGQVAIQIAANGNLLLQKLLLVSTTPCFCRTDDWQHGLPKTQVKALERNLGRAYEKTLGDFFNLQFVGEELSKQRYRQILTFSVRSSCLPTLKNACKSLSILSGADLRHVLADIKLPVLVMHGELDQIVPVAAGAYLADKFPNAEFCRMPAIGHAPFFSCPEETASRWLNFLQ